MNKLWITPKLITFISVLFFAVLTAQAQMSYQVSLLNTATGEPRANVTVAAQVTITNSQNEQVYTTTQRITSNDFGVLQFVVGDADTFKSLDTGKLPLFIEVSVDGTSIGKSQIMTVPVAEVANTLKSSFTKEDLNGTWKEEVTYNYHDYETLTFSDDGVKHCSYMANFDDYGNFLGTYYCEFIISGDYKIEGDNIYIYIHKVEYDLDGIITEGFTSYSRMLRYHNNILYPDDYKIPFTKQ